MCIHVHILCMNSMFYEYLIAYKYLNCTLNIPVGNCLNCCVHYLCLKGWVHVFYVGHIDKIMKLFFHVVILNKHHHHHHHNRQLLDFLPPPMVSTEGGTGINSNVGASTKRGKCMYLYLYVYIYICTCIYVRIYVCIFVYICLYMYVYI
jgi:hypothetical protein